jgi:hypothetical protein
MKEISEACVLQASARRVLINARCARASRKEFLMGKKLITACLGLVAFAAFVLPATASASPVITHPTGTVLDLSKTSCTGVAGTACVTATNIGVTKMKDTANNTLTECSTATMTGYLTKNSGTEIEGDIHNTTFSGSGTSGECTSTFGGITVDTNIGEGTPWCIKATSKMEPNEFQVIGGNCGTAKEITFVLTSTTVGTCKYTRETKTSPIKGTYTTHSTGDAVLSLAAGANTSFSKEEGGIFCPSEGTLEMSFTLETDTPAVAPLYIS